MEVIKNEYGDKRDSAIERAKETAIALIGSSSIPDDVTVIFDETNLEVIESNIKTLNEYSDQCWLLSAIATYTLIFDKELYRQSGLLWDQYVTQARERLGMESRDFYEQISSARFFIKNHVSLLKAGWKPNGSRRKLARAELANSLCDSTRETIKHLVNDTWAEFNAWYSALKNPIVIEADNTDLQPRKDIDIDSKGNIKVNNIVPVAISKDLNKKDKVKLEQCILDFFKALKDGYYPAIIPTYDEREAKKLVVLRDKSRMEK